MGGKGRRQETLGTGAGEEGAGPSPSGPECQLLLRSENLRWEIRLKLLQGCVASHLSNKNRTLTNEEDVGQMHPQSHAGRCPVLWGKIRLGGNKET